MNQPYLPYFQGCWPKHLTAEQKVKTWPLDCPLRQIFKETWLTGQPYLALSLTSLGWSGLILKTWSSPDSTEAFEGCPYQLSGQEPFMVGDEDHWAVYQLRANLEPVTPYHNYEAGLILALPLLLGLLVLVWWVNRR